MCLPWLRADGTALTCSANLGKGITAGSRYGCSCSGVCSATSMAAEDAVAKSPGPHDNHVTDTAKCTIAQGLCLTATGSMQLDLASHPQAKAYKISSMTCIQAHRALHLGDLFGM